MSATATAVVTSVAANGAPLEVTSAVRRHSKPSRPMANRMRVPIIMIALRSGGSETSDNTVMIWRPRPPIRICAASAAGSVDRARSGTGSTDSRARFTSRYTTITEATPAIIERGRLRVGSRSSSVKYSALCQPPYVMTTAWSATTTPTNEGEGAGPGDDAAADDMAGASTSAATTTARNATKDRKSDV